VACRTPATTRRDAADGGRRGEEWVAWVVTCHAWAGEGGGLAPERGRKGRQGGEGREDHFCWVGVSCHASQSRVASIPGK
jgi:hypothetical protein